jgi:hypothetical protein
MRHHGFLTRSTCEAYACRGDRRMSRHTTNTRVQIDDFKVCSGILGCFEDPPYAIVIFAQQICTWMRIKIRIGNQPSHDVAAAIENNRS